MEKAIRENDYVLIVCTPQYKAKSDGRKGGTGYEGDMMTGEIFTQGNHRKFIPILREGDWVTAMPTWLGGKYGIDLHGTPYSEEQYKDLLATIQNRREKAPPIGTPQSKRLSLREQVKPFLQREETPGQFEPIKIVGILFDEVGEPLRDGSRGSALYAVPFKLSRSPSREWSDLFIRVWDHPPKWSSQHRPGTARVTNDRIVLTRTTIEEVKEVHRETLKVVVEEVNRQIETQVRQRRMAIEAENRQRQNHSENVRKIAGEINFD